MIVGDVVKLKEPLLGNASGTIGFVYHDYAFGVQVIFENGNYDGFEPEEQNRFLEKVGHDEKVANYNFKNVICLGVDFNNDFFPF